MLDGNVDVMEEKLLQVAEADEALKAHEKEREELDLVEAARVADKQLQLSLLSTQDADEDQHHQNSSSSDSLDGTSDNEDEEDDAGPSCQLCGQAQPLGISSSDESPDHNSDNEPRRTGRLSMASFLFLAPEPESGL
jgi:hypothetical protein